MSKQSFTADSQSRFAELSGDYNPLHVDAVHARRLMFGAPVVHGLHSLLWSLDAWIARFDRRIALDSIKASFPKPVRVGEEIELSINKDQGQQARLLTLCRQETVARIDIVWRESSDADAAVIPSHRFDAVDPVELQTYENASGELALFLDVELATRLLPHLCSRLPAHQIASLLASTRLVGMDCPGLHSVYSDITLSFKPAIDATPIAYQVKSVDERFALLTMQLASPAVSGVIRAFIRPRPCQQRPFTELRKQVDGQEFAGQRALIVGGSRGLGEVTAKLLAAGGAQVLITYHQGAADAEALVSEMVAAGVDAGSAAFNVLDPQAAPAGEVLKQWAPTHLYYFATPFIATGKSGSFSQPLLEKFCSYYVSGFLGTVNLLAGSGLTAVFSPSSVFVEDVPDTLFEYAAAKASAEFVCAQLAAKRAQDLKVSWPRLPKLDTDQTAALAASDNPDPAPVMLQALRDFVRG